MPGTRPILPLPAPPSDNEEDKSKEQLSSSSESADSTPVASVATHTQKIGIIHPPPDVSTIVDKTAQFVAKNGLDFEKRILTENTGKAKFSFLSRLDPYHVYHQHRISELRAQLQSSARQTILSQLPPADSAADGKKRWLSLMMLQPCSSCPSARSLSPQRLNITQFCFQKGLLAKNLI